MSWRGWMSRPKFTIGQRVVYADDRRMRRTVVARYWDADLPGWRYKLSVVDLPPRLTAYWWVIENALAVVVERVKR